MGIIAILVSFIFYIVTARIMVCMTIKVDKWYRDEETKIGLK